jgi:glycosyltransferase involved in cell wall biosynthesis
MGHLRVMRVIARMNVGGPAVQVSGLMRHLPQDEFDQRLYTGWCADDEADYLETQAPDVDATRIDGLGRAIRPGEDALALGSLVRAMREFRPHIVHTHTAKAGVLGRAAVKASGVGSASVHTFHGHLLHGYFSPAKTRAVIGIERLLARSTDRLVAVGAQVRDDLLAAGIGRPGQYAIIPPGLELPGALSQEEARRALGIRPGDPTVAFIGRLTSIKRPDRFVEIVRRVARTYPGVQFVVAGEGDESGVVRSAAESLPITMLGWRSDVENVLAASDAVLLTSDNEGTPLSLIQAAMSGLPVVASDVGSVSDVVVAGQTGWLAPADDFALATATAEMLADPAEARRRGLAAKERADRLYGVQRLADDHARIYREIAATRSRA